MIVIINNNTMALCVTWLSFCCVRVKDEEKEREREALLSWQDFKDCFA